jgi:vitellogenic carboxypeptidase-like protein
MHILLKAFALSLFISLSVSRLILPSDLPRIREHNAKYLKPELADTSKPLTAGSTAHPVQGIQNATSGYLSVNDPATESKLFYVFYSCRNLARGQVPKDVPIVIWLQGGPGSSSFLGGFMEFGPYRLEKDSATGKYKEVVNERSWNDYYNLLIVDNPRGTGYSVADDKSFVTSQDEVAEDFLNALQNFYQLDAFSAFDQTPLYIFGESYGGHYIPSISKRVVQYNQGSPAQKIPLSGIGIGDGWTDPIHQLANYANFGFSLGYLDYNEKKKVEHNQLLGIGNILQGNYVNALNNFDVVCDSIVAGAGGINVYNFRLWGNYDLSSLGAFFNDAATATRYNIDPSRIGTFTESNDDVYNALSNDFMQSVADRVAFVAEAGLPVLLYNGQYDVIVNTPSALNWIGQLEWSGQIGFYNAPLQNWIFNNGTPVGLAKNYKNFSFVIVNKAGHMAPEDQLEPSIEMLRRFTSGNNHWNQTFTA